jgi:hypothetical protein
MYEIILKPVETILAMRGWVGKNDGGCEFGYDIL